MKPTTSSSVDALLTPIAPNHPMSRLVFYLSSKEHFTARIEKILNQKHRPVVKLITDLKGHDGINKNALIDYLELKSLSSNDDSPISELSCQKIFERSHRIISSHEREATAWLFQGQNPIFYRLLKHKWYELQNDTSLKNHWHEMLSLIINADCIIPIKVSLLSMIVKFPLNQSWLEFLFYYQQNLADSSNRYWLLNFLEEFAATRKNTCMICLELILSQEHESYIINLSAAEVIQINELLAAYHCGGFVLTQVSNNFYQISQINRQNCAVLKEALNFSFALRSSLFTHQTILKGIFLNIREKVFSFPIQMIKKDEKFLNRIYTNYFCISYENNFASITFTSVPAYNFILQKLSLIINNNSNLIPSANQVETQPTTSFEQNIEEPNEIPLTKAKLPKKKVKSSRKKTEFSQEEVQPLKKVKSPKKSVKSSEESESARALKKNKRASVTLPPIYLENPSNQERSTEKSEIGIIQQNELTLSNSLNFLKELHNAADLSKLSPVDVPSHPQEISREVIETPATMKTRYNNPAIKDSLAAFIDRFGILSAINKTSKINPNFLQPESDSKKIDLY